MNRNNFSVRPVDYEGISPNTETKPYVNEVPQILAFLREIDIERDSMFNMDIATMDRRIRTDMDDMRVIWMLLCSDGRYGYAGMCSLQPMHNPSFQTYNYYLDNFHLKPEYCNLADVKTFYELIKGWVILNDGSQIFISMENNNKLCSEILYNLDYKRTNMVGLLDKWDDSKQ